MKTKLQANIVTAALKIRKPLHTQLRIRAVKDGWKIGALAELFIFRGLNQARDYEIPQSKPKKTKSK